MEILLFILWTLLVCFCFFSFRTRATAKTEERPTSCPEERTTPDVARIEEPKKEEPFLDPLESEDIPSYVFTVETMFPDSYTAIDFETATTSRMACQLGLVMVDNGRIVLEREYLIQPPKNMYDAKMILVHGITPEKTAAAPQFNELWPAIRSFFEGRYVVAHNASFDEAVLGQNLDYYGLPRPKILGFGCTCGPFGRVSLFSATTYFGIELGDHHDALADARACALLAQEYNRHFGETICIPKLKEKSARVVSKENQGWKDDLGEVPDNYFKGKTVVITGIFDSYPSRDELAGKLKDLGARVTSSISKRTAIVIAGYGAGPSKLQKVEELKDAGGAIEIMDEEQLTQELQKVSLASDCIPLKARN